MAKHYGIIANCNYESSDNDRDIHEIRLAVESGRVDDADLIDAMDELEATLEEFADQENVEAKEACVAAERAVREAWDACQIPVE